MTMPLTWASLGLIAFCIVTETAREVCFKMAASSSEGLTVLRQPVTWAGIGFWLVEILAWSKVLASLSLSIAFPVMALSYVTIALAGAWIFKENITLKHAVGVGLVTAGVICVGATGL